ncbi:hypothetical protein [Diaphorobacter aerolatus]|uniref:Bacterial deaminase MsddA-like domain-containing protein n=1 Tax=Diaphorobacter aerolatus TaxID=1288495 RepID=A0A7H0GLC1_9BURK|nr:hypothetical protein [Diaphorobacter aerolatus]QNP49087.1 hypothetical protein H9K75_02750 [Diaphorobacter aerolatus]
MKLPNGKTTLYAAGSSGKLNPRQRARLQELGVPEANIIHGKGSALPKEGNPINVNHAEQIIIRNIPEGSQVTRKGISWGVNKQMHLVCTANLVWMVLEVFMIDIVSHVDRVQHESRKLDAANKGRFGAWCVNYLFQQKDILDSVKTNIEPSAVELLRTAINSCWNSNDPAVDDNTISQLEAVEWDPDSDESGGLDELFGAATSMAIALQENDENHTANCAERVLNYLDYVYTPPSASKDVYENIIQAECEKQIKMIELLQDRVDSLSLNSLR